NLAVAGDEAPADRAHRAPLGAIDRHRGHDAKGWRQHLGADVLARRLDVTTRAREIELSAPRVEIFLPLAKGRERARIVGDLDVEALAARRERHIGGERRHVVLDVVERLFAILLTALVERELECDHLARLRIEHRIVLADADALVGEAVAISLAVP